MFARKPKSRVTADWRSVWRLKAPLQGGELLFRDMRGIARVWEIRPRNGEALHPSDLIKLREQLSDILERLPKTTPPWILHFYAQDVPADVVAEEIRLSALSQSHRLDLREQDRYRRQWQRRELVHSLRTLRQGLGMDIRGKAWRPRTLRVRLLLYRDSATSSRQPQSLDDERKAVSQLARMFEKDLIRADLQPRPLPPAEVLHWLRSWLLPQGSEHVPTQGLPVSLDALYRDRGWDLADAVLGDMPAQLREDGLWRIGTDYSLYLSVDSLLSSPDPKGLFLGTQTLAMAGSIWDSMPDGAVWSMAIVCEALDQVRQKIQSVKRNAQGVGADSNQCLSDCERAEKLLTAGRLLCPVSAGVYFFAPDPDACWQKAAEICASFAEAGVRLTPPHLEAFAADAWLQHLPGNFTPSADRLPGRRRARLWHGIHSVALAPLVAGGAGDKTGAMRFHSRGGEEIRLDPLSPTGREQNAHSLILGPTGSGKTALLIYMLLQLAAHHRPRFFLITTLPTFGLLGACLQRYGWTVRHLSIGRDTTCSLPPFSSNPGSRDHLGVIDLMAGLMAHPEGDRLLQPWEKDALRSAVLQAGAGSKAGPSVSQVVRHLRQEGTDTSIPEAHRVRIREMAASMHRFTQGVAGEIFDHPGEDLEEVDCTILDLGIAARRGNEHLKALAYAGLLMRVNDLIEARAEEDRQTLVVTDEAHSVLRHPALLPYISSITAQWRTWGAWKWLCTQSLRQFPEQAKDLLALMEWWWILGPDRDEIEQISSFRGVSSQAAIAMQSLHKAPGSYTECLLLSRRYPSLIARVVPPPLALALAQTEQHERVARRELMRQHGLPDELDAVFRVARAMGKRRGRGS